MKAFVLAEEGARLGCHHCQGLMAYHYLEGLVCHKDCARSQELARESAERGCRYGQYALGELLLSGAYGLAQDPVQAVVFFRLATEQGLDAAQNRLGCMYSNGQGVDKDSASALRLFQFAAAQGYPDALFNIAFSHEEGEGVTEDVAEAIRWYRRAQAAGCCQATNELLRLGA